MSCDRIDFVTGIRDPKNTQKDVWINLFNHDVNNWTFRVVTKHIYDVRASFILLHMHLYEGVFVSVTTFINKTSLTDQIF